MSEHQLSDDDYDFVSSVLSSRKNIVDLVNRDISFASGLASNTSGDTPDVNNYEFDDIKQRCKSFTFNVKSVV